MSAGAAPFDITIPVYEGVDLMDVAAPVEMFSWMARSWKARTVTVTLAAHYQAPLKTRDGTILTPTRRFEDYVAQGRQAQLVWVPGGDPASLNHLMKGGPFLDFLRLQAPGADYVASVCEGAFLLAAAGLLDGYRATTHWAFLPCFAAFPRITVAEGHPRYVVDRDRVTGGGISAGLDEALKLIELIAGEQVAKDAQLTTQYFPKPPFHQDIPPATSCPLDLALR